MRKRIVYILLFLIVLIFTNPFPGVFPAFFPSRFFSEYKESQVLSAKEKNFVKPLYPNHNNINSSRLNLIFVGAEYDDPKDLEKICRDMIALRGENKFGLMQIKPFCEPGFSRHFNFWICKKIGYSGKSYDKLTNNEMWEITSTVFNEAVEDLNRQYKTQLKREEKYVTGVLLVNADPNKIPGYKYGGGSFGKSCTFTVWHTEAPWFAYNDMIITHVHELAHSIPGLLDEYSGKGSIYDNPNWKTLNYGGQLFVPGSSEDRGKIKPEQFLKLSEDKKMEYIRRNIPWRNYLGKGKGDLQIGIFEGGLGKSKNIYRSAKNSIMNYPYGLVPGKTLGFGEYVETLIRKRIEAEFRN